MKRHSLTRRLIVILTLGAAAAWLVAAAIAAYGLRSGVDAAFDAGLRETAERILPLALDSLRDRDVDKGDEPAPDEPHHPGTVAEKYLIYQLRDASGAVLLRSDDAPLAPFGASTAPGIATFDQLRIYTSQPTADGLYVQVAEAYSHRRAALLNSLWALVWPLVLLVPAAVAGIYAAVRSGLRPIRQVRSELEQRHGTHLAPVDLASLPAELMPFGQAVNGLMERLGAAIEAERSFAANSAHELRTPIAGSLAQTQRLIAELGDTPVKARAMQVEASILRLGHLSDKLLQLSRADSGLGAAPFATDLLPAFRLVVDDFARSYPKAWLLIDEAADADLLAAVDVDAFGIMLRNLLENARLYGPQDRAIRVRIGAKTIEVENDCEAIPADTLLSLVHRFVRASSRQGGTGLGLAIVESLVRQAGGSLSLVSPLPGQSRGFLARIRLP